MTADVMIAPATTVCSLVAGLGACAEKCRTAVCVRVLATAPARLMVADLVQRLLGAAEDVYGPDFRACSRGVINSSRVECGEFLVCEGEVLRLQFRRGCCREGKESG